MPSIEEIKRLIEAATPGPWTHKRSKDEPISIDLRPGYWFEAWTSEGFNESCDPKKDAAFIAASRTLMPKLLAVAEAAKGIRHYDHCAYGMGDCPCTCDVGPIDVALDALEAE